MPIALQLIAESGGPAILPDDRVVDGLAGGAIPNQRRLALVGDADGLHVGRADSRPRQHLDSGAALRRPDLDGVMFHPAGLGKNLGELLLCDGFDDALFIEQNGARTGCALVKGKNQGHMQVV